MHLTQAPTQAARGGPPALPATHQLGHSCRASPLACRAQLPGPRTRPRSRASSQLRPSPSVRPNPGSGQGHHLPAANRQLKRQRVPRSTAQQQLPISPPRRPAPQRQRRRQKRWGPARRALLPQLRRRQGMGKSWRKRRQGRLAPATLAGGTVGRQDICRLRLRRRRHSSPMPFLRGAAAGCSFCFVARRWVCQLQQLQQLSSSSSKIPLPWVLATGCLRGLRPLLPSQRPRWLWALLIWAQSWRSSRVTRRGAVADGSPCSAARCLACRPRLLLLLSNSSSRSSRTLPLATEGVWHSSLPQQCLRRRVRSCRCS